MDGTTTLITVNQNLRLLLLSEQLWLWRIRQSTRREGYVRGQRTRLSRADAAVKFGVELDYYVDAERGDEAAAAALWSKVAAIEPDAVREGPTRGEQCALARRRSGMSLDEIRSALGGITKMHLYRLEGEGRDEVVRFWRERGFVF